MAAYLTVAEYRAAPTAVDTNNLVINGSAADQDAELARRIARASAWCDSVCNQPLVAGRRQEMGRLRPTASRFTFHPSYGPLCKLLTLEVGRTPSTLVTVDITSAWINEQNLELDPVVAPYASPAIARWTYVSGWANTTTTAAITAGATTIPVSDVSGFTFTAGAPGTYDTVQLIDPYGTDETLTVTGVSGSNLTVSAVTSAHGAGTTISTLPADVKEAAVLATTAFIQSRGSEAVVLSQSVAAGPPTGEDVVRSANLRTARSILLGGGYQRIQ